MLNVTAAGWGATLALLSGLLILDLVVSARRGRAVRFREAAAWSLFYIAVALLFGVLLGPLAGWDISAQYLAAYVVEKSLSVDNLFVFVVIVGAFAVPVAQQSQALTIGIALALILRLALIAAGAALLASFEIVFLLFGLLLAFTAGQLLRHRHEEPSIEDNFIVSAARRALPLSDRYHGGKLVTRVGRRRLLTPMFLVVLAIGSTDVLFALDSIPAAFGVTQHVYVVFAANAFALLGLRALFFLVTGLLDRLVYLSTGLALILALIGLKLILHYAHLQDSAVPEISTVASLASIVVLLALTTLASLFHARRHPDARARPGSLRERRRERTERPPAEREPVPR